MPPRPPAAEIDVAGAEDEGTLCCFPPDDPGRLFRASLICKAWRTLVTDPGFGDRYRQFHRTPPLLGFFENDDDVRVWFEPSSPTSPFPPLPPDHRELEVVDCRHGLVLLRYPVLEWDEHAQRLIVWDPVGARQWEFPPPEFAAGITYANAVVLCAADPCDHLRCHGRPFRVAYVGTDPSLAKASVFSSETREWSPVADCHSPEPNLEIEAYQPKVLVGNVLYFNCGSMILGFDYIGGELSLIQGPVGKYYVLMKTKEDVLGCATMQESELRLWSRQTVTDGSVAWMQRRVVKLEEHISRGRDISDVVDIVEDGIGVFYLSTNRGILTIDLQSGRVKNNIANPIRGHSIIPYTSFYTPDQARAITTMSSSSEGNGEDWGVWEEVGDGEKEGEQQEDEAAQEHFANGSKAFEDGDFVTAVDCLSSSLKIRAMWYLVLVSPLML